MRDNVRVHYTIHKFSGLNLMNFYILFLNQTNTDVSSYKSNLLCYTNVVIPMSLIAQPTCVTKPSGTWKTKTYCPNEGGILLSTSTHLPNADGIAHFYEYRPEGCPLQHCLSQQRFSH